MIVDRTEWTDLRTLVRREIDADHARQADRERAGALRTPPGHTPERWSANAQDRGGEGAGGPAPRREAA